MRLTITNAQLSSIRKAIRFILHLHGAVPDLRDRRLAEQAEPNQSHREKARAKPSWAVIVVIPVPYLARFQSSRAADCNSGIAWGTGSLRQLNGAS